MTPNTATQILDLIGEAAQSQIKYSNYFDITDLLVFLTRSPVVTGIQRVHVETIRSQESENNHVLYVFLDTDSNWRIANQNAVWRLLEKSAHPNLSWQAEVADFKERIGEGALVSFTSDDVLYFLGVSWLAPGIFESLYALGSNGPRCVFYIHDVIPLSHPEYHVPELETIFSYWAYHVALLADAVVCNSESTKQDFIAATGYKRLARVANLNIAPHTLTNITSSIEQDVLLEHNLIDQSFVLMVGTIEPRKNHIAIANVWCELHRQFGSSCPKLVIAGRTGWHAEGICQHINTMNRSGKILHLEGLSDAHLAVLYKRCFFTVYLSRHEGWGLPVTESLALGKVCVSADNSSLREAGQDLTILVDDRSERDIERAISTLVAEPKIVREHELTIRSQLSMKTWQDLNFEICNIVSDLSKKNEPKIHSITPDTIYWFGRGHQSNAFSGGIPGEFLRAGSGWHSPEDWGSWTNAKKARLEFYVSEPGDCDVYLLVNAPPGGATLTLSCADRPLWEGDVKRQKLLHGQLGLIAAGQLVEIQLSIDKMGEQPIRKDSDQKRAIGAGWIAMRLQRRPENGSEKSEGNSSTLKILSEFLAPGFKSTSN